MYLIDAELSYYKKGNWTQQWRSCDGCRPVSVQGMSLDKPPPPLPDLPKAQSGEKKTIKIPPFDIQEIPDAMKLEGMPVAATRPWAVLFRRKSTSSWNHNFTETAPQMTLPAHWVHSIFMLHLQR